MIASVAMRFLIAFSFVLVPGAYSQPPDMQAIAKALGVGCEYCHASDRGAPEPKKDIARAMLAMTKDINARIQQATGLPANQSVQVTCATCHRGAAIPRSLGDVLSQTMKEKGIDAAIEQYRELRKQFYGRQAYDFGEDTLISVARTIVQVRPSDSIALLQLNLEFYPQSAATYAEIAFAHTRKLDDASAIANLEKALDIEPNNGVYRGQLEQLKSYQRRRQ